MTRRLLIWWVPATVLGLLPAAWLVLALVTDRLGANPVEALLHQTGLFGLQFLLLTLAVSPLRRWTGWKRLHAMRRPLGLLAFFYLSVHLGIYLGLDRMLVWNEIVTDITKRPYITVGFLAFLLLIPLAVTSTRAMVRRLGQRWFQLHRLVYLAPVLGVLHFAWAVKADLREPLIYGSILLALLGYRLIHHRRLTRRSPAAASR